MCEVSSAPYRIRRSDRARRARIQVSADGVEVVVPRRLPMRDVEPFVEEKRPWIERTLRRMREAEAEHSPPVLEDGEELPFMGERLTLRVHVEPARARPHVARKGDMLHVKVAASDGASLRDALERWYRRQAREEIGPRLDRASARARTSYTTLQIRAQRTRWASCSSTGAMSFNWRLLLAPEEILEYVIEHEVVHLQIHDHSEKFWTELKRRVPEYKTHERWLKRYGQTLRL